VSVPAEAFRAGKRRRLLAAPALAGPSQDHRDVIGSEPPLRSPFLGQRPRPRPDAATEPEPTDPPPAHVRRPTSWRADTAAPSRHPPAPSPMLVPRPGDVVHVGGVLEARPSPSS